MEAENHFPGFLANKIPDIEPDIEDEKFFFIFAINYVTMNYYFTKTLNCSFEEAESRVHEGLSKVGMGIVMEIDFREKFKEKLNVDFRPYKVLGACSPGHAYRSILKEDKLGVLLPCNVLIQQIGDKLTEVSVMDPEGAMMAVNNPEVKCITDEVRIKLQHFIEEL